jgi:hypothetical protein
MAVKKVEGSGVFFRIRVNREQLQSTLACRKLAIDWDGIARGPEFSGENKLSPLSITTAHVSR